MLVYMANAGNQASDIFRHNVRMRCKIFDFEGVLKTVELSDDDDEPPGKEEVAQMTGMMISVDSHHRTRNRRVVPPWTVDFTEISLALEKRRTKTHSARRDKQALSTPDADECWSLEEGKLQG